VNRLLVGMLLLVLLGLTGCQELRGPVWSPDGGLVAYTAYSRPLKPNHPMSTSVYLADAEDETCTPTLLAKDAAFPCWSSAGPSLYLLGHRKGAFYTSILCHRPGGVKLGEGMLETVLQENGLRLVGFQLSIDGKSAILCSARKPQPGAPQTLEFFKVPERVRVSLKQLGEVYSPALSPNGRILAFSQRPKAADSRPFVAVLELDRKPLQPVTIFPTAEFDEPAASHYIVHVFPNSETVLFYAPFGKSLWTARRDGKRLRSYPLPKGYSAPLLVVIAGDGKSASVTMARPVEGELQYEVFALNLVKGNFLRLDGPSRELLGGHAVEPRMLGAGANRWAWLSPAGLAVGAPGKARYFPRTADEWHAASTAYLKQGESQKALVAAQKAREIKPPALDRGAIFRAEARAALALGNGAQAASAWERAELLYPINERGIPWVFPPQSGLPQNSNTAARAQALQAFAAAAPDNQLIATLSTALAARLKGASDEALKLYGAAIEMCPAESMVAGVKFQAALAAYESGNPGRAGEHWESAARCNNYPQADYASGLSAMAYKLDGRPGMNERADSALRLGVARNSVIKQDLLALPRDLHGRAYRQKRSETEQKSPNKALRAWFEVTEYELPLANLRPRPVFDADGKNVLRRVGCSRVSVSELNVAGLPQGTQMLARVPFAVSTPLFSPDGRMVAFQAKGDIFPKGRAFCETYVVNLGGAILHGNTQALTSGRLATRSRVTSLQWAGPQSLVVSGTTVDAFGGEKPFQRSVTVTGR